MRGALAPISFASSRFRDFAKQIIHLRQPDELDLRKIRLFGLRISFSLLSFVRAGFPLLYSHILADVRVMPYLAAGCHGACAL